MRRRGRFSLAGIVERMAGLPAPRHRELVRAMVAELESITDRGERWRFALGAIAAILRLSLSRFRRGVDAVPDRLVGIPAGEGHVFHGEPSMQAFSSRWLLRRHVRPFVVTLVLLTGLLVANSANKDVPRLAERGASLGTMLEAALLTIPATVALTIPMAVFVAVLWVFTRLGAEGVGKPLWRDRHRFRRLVAPVLAAAGIIAALTFASNDQVLPRANARFAGLITGSSTGYTTGGSDRSMTISELREAARTALTRAEPRAAARAAEYRVEIQKKIALSASCLFLALAGATLGLRFARGGKWLVVGASMAVFTGYYLALVGGEALADQQMVSPFVAMWSANGALLLNAMLILWRPGDPGAAPPAESLVVGR